MRDWADKHRIWSVSDYTKADLAALIDAIARRAAGRSKRQVIEYDLPV